MKKNWEERVYARYVTTGNLPNQADPNLLFGQNQPYIKKTIREHFPKNKAARILELACGAAPFLYFLKKEGYSNLTGIDISPQQVSLAHAIGLRDEVHQDNIVSFLNMQSSNRYDVIILFDILEHFAPAEQFEVLDKAFARLTPQGKCILHVPNADGVFGSRVRYSDITHKTAFTNRSITQLLRTIGFTQIQCFEDKPIPHSLFSVIRRGLWEIFAMGQVFILAIETGNLHRHQYIFSQNMLVVAQK